MVEFRVGLGRFGQIALLVVIVAAAWAALWYFASNMGGSPDTSQIRTNSSDTVSGKLTSPPQQE